VPKTKRCFGFELQNDYEELFNGCFALPLRQAQCDQIALRDCPPSTGLWSCDDMFFSNVNFVSQQAATEKSNLQQ